MQSNQSPGLFCNIRRIAPQSVRKQHQLQEKGLRKSCLNYPNLGELVDFSNSLSNDLRTSLFDKLTKRPGGLNGVQNTWRSKTK
jgi:hypothetical protein